MSEPVVVQRNGVGFPEYHGRSRFPKQQPKGICRGCRGPITEKYRKTWCSHECHQKFDPFYVKQLVRQRDKERCVFCGRDCSRKAQWVYRETSPNPPEYEKDCGLKYPWDAAKFHAHPLYQDYCHKLRKWERQRPKPEYDHIVPHSEGGLFTVENIRLLCHECHLQRTAEWLRQKSKLIKCVANQMEML